MKTTSQPGKGSRFDVYLPACSETPGIQSIQKETKIKGGNQSILFVDDETVLCTIFKASLSPFGYHVETFDKSEDALCFFKKNPARFDLIISDIILPGIPGDILVKKAREIKPGIPAILITGSSNLINEQVIAELHINALLFKPITTTKMIETIQTIFEGKE